MRSLTITIHAFLSAVLSSRVRGAEACCLRECEERRPVVFASARGGGLYSLRGVESGRERGCREEEVVGTSLFCFPVSLVLFPLLSLALDRRVQ